MQYIEKSLHPPADWEQWFTTTMGTRSFDYEADYSTLRDLPYAKEHLLKEQHGLCAYCQSPITALTSSIEHIIPKSQNIHLSTAYHNLVAVCKKPTKDASNGRYHCDKERGNKTLLPLVLLDGLHATSTRNHQLLQAWADGTIKAKSNIKPDKATRQEVESYIETLNLNHSFLKYERKKHLNAIIDIFKSIPKNKKQSFYKSQIQAIDKNPRRGFKQFLLMWLLGKNGVN